MWFALDKNFNSDIVFRMMGGGVYLADEVLSLTT